MSTIPEVKVGMIGVSGAGKTWFMTGMFATMCRGVNGFTLNSKIYQQGLRLNSSWKAIVDGGEKRSMPTFKFEDWEFDCCHAYRAILGFTLKDYRGGILQGETEMDEVDDVIDYLCECSCIFIMIPANQLDESLPDYEDVQFSAYAISQILSKYFGKNGKKCPVVLLITKSDKLIVPKDLNATEKKFDSARKVLMDMVAGPLFEGSAECPVFICPVSLGEDLRRDEANGRIDPINIHLPMVFAMSIAVKQAIDIKKDEINNKLNYAKNAQNAASEYRAGNAIQRWWYKSDAESADSRASYYTSDADSIKKELACCESDNNLLVEALSRGRNCYFSYNGRENITIHELLRRV